MNLNSKTNLICMIVVLASTPVLCSGQSRKATVLSVMPNGFTLVQANSNQALTVYVDKAKTDLEIEGKVDPSFLQRNLYVEFEVEMDNKKAASNVEKINLVTPSATKLPGFKIEDRNGKKIGVGIGKILRVNKGKDFTISFPRKTSKISSLKITIDPNNVNITMDGFREFQVAKLHDKVQFDGEIYRERKVVNGLAIESTHFGSYVATKMKITLNAPLKRGTRFKR